MGTNELATAIREHADLAMQYATLAARNYTRIDLTYSWPVVDGEPREPALVRRGDEWVCMAVMPDGTLRHPDRFIGLPRPDKTEEIARVGLEQHQLHVRLHEAARRVRELAAAPSISAVESSLQSLKRGKEN